LNQTRVELLKDENGKDLRVKEKITPYNPEKHQK
jgi:hypothetical protein